MNVLAAFLSIFVFCLTNSLANSLFAQVENQTIDSTQLVSHQDKRMIDNKNGFASDFAVVVNFRTHFDLTDTAQFNQAQFMLEQMFAPNKPVFLPDKKVFAVPFDMAIKSKIEPKFRTLKEKFPESRVFGVYTSELGL